MAKKYSSGVSSSSLRKEMTANKVFGTPLISQAMKKKAPPASAMMKKKMSPDALAKRKRTRISNVASKTMGGLYSK